jgi:xanthine dehydrogenase accessory factor
MSFVLVRGGGDLASGVALRLHQYGFPVMISELPMPVAVRRNVCFASAVYSGRAQVGDCLAWRVDDPVEAPELIDKIADKGGIPVLIDPNGDAIKFFGPKVVVDGRMLKRHLSRQSGPMPMLIGLGPGFIAGENCDAAVETRGGGSMGEVIWDGPVEPNNSISHVVDDIQEERVLRAPVDGHVKTFVKIGDHVDAGTIIAQVGSQPIVAAFHGILRGLIYPGSMVKKGMRLGDLDPRDKDALCNEISHKSRAVAAGVLSAICSKFDLADFKH